MRTICGFLCLAAIVQVALPAPAPAEGFAFPDERREKKLEPIITPPVLPVLEHLERDPSTLLPHERRAGFKSNPSTRPSSVGQASPRFNPSPKRGFTKPRYGFGGGLNVSPSPGGLTASVSSSANGGGASHSASQSFSFGFNEGFSGSHSASQASSFNGFGSGFGGSQASSQAASFGAGAGGASGSASQAASFGGGGGSQSASSAFGFNSLNGFQHEPTFGEGLLDIRHRGVPDFPTFPQQFIPNFFGKSKGIGAAAFRSENPSRRSKDEDFLTIVVSD